MPRGRRCASRGRCPDCPSSARHGLRVDLYAKVRAVTRVATPGTEQRLLDVALAGTAAHVERIVRAWRRTDRVRASHEADARHLSRHLTTWIDDDGMLVLRGRLTPEIGAVLHRALEAADGPADNVLEVDDAAIRISAESSERLACDASVVTMHHDADGQVLDGGRKTRTVPTAIRRALSARDTRCQFPGCSAKRCDAHHIDHWMNGGPTSLDNLVLLCRRHHRLVHEGRFTLRWRPDRTIAFFYPDGSELRIAPPQPPLDIGHPLAPTTARLAALGIGITPRTLPTWDGGPLNLGYALDVLYVPPASLQRTPS